MAFDDIESVFGKKIHAPHGIKQNESIDFYEFFFIDYLQEIAEIGKITVHETDDENGVIALDNYLFFFKSNKKGFVMFTEFFYFLYPFSGNNGGFYPD